jgi:hypothetical protein
MKDFFKMVKNRIMEEPYIGMVIIMKDDQINSKKLDFENYIL